MQAAAFLASSCPCRGRGGWQRLLDRFPPQGNPGGRVQEGSGQFEESPHFGNSSVAFCISNKRLRRSSWGGDGASGHILTNGNIADAHVSGEGGTKCTADLHRANESGGAGY